MSQKSSYDLPDDMPEPSTASGGRLRAIIWAFLFLVILAGTGIWLLADDKQKDDWRDYAANSVNSLASGTPLAGIGELLRGTPPPLPTQILTPPTEKGTLSGRQVTGVIASPVEVGGRAVSPGQMEDFPVMSRSGNAAASTESQAPASGQPVFSPEPVPAVKEDSTVRPAYFQDLAQWLVSRYKPGPNGGTLALNVQNLNQICGVTLAAKTAGGRSSLLRYVFQPSMIQGLYNLYINNFMEDLDMAARKRGMSARENHDFHLAVAGRASMLANALEGIMNVPDLDQKLATMEDLGQKTVEINSQLANTVFELDELRQQNAPANQINTTQLRVNGIAARYRRAMDAYENAQRALATEIRQKSGQIMDDDSLLFMAAWAGRRLGSDADARSALQAGVNIFHDLARRCGQPTTQR